MSEDFEMIKEKFDEMMPGAILANLEIVIEESGKPEKVNLGEVIDSLHLVREYPQETLTYLLKVKQGICNLAYSAEEYHARTEDAFRVWKASINRTLNFKDERNPLVKEGSKTTNAAAKAYLRSDSDYEEFKNKMSEIERFKNVLWTAKKTVESAVEVGKLLIGPQVEGGEEVSQDEFDEKLAEIAAGLETEA